MAAGTIYQNTKKGGQTVILCATDGERGTAHIQQALSSRQLKTLRRKELQSSAAFLGVKKVLYVHTPDGEVRSQRSTIFQRVRQLAQAFKPDLIMSFGANGMTGHQDHIAISRIALRVAKKMHLHFFGGALPPRVARQAIKSLKKRQRTGKYAKQITYIKPTCTIKIDPKIKLRALRYHRSQMDAGQPFRGFSSASARALLSTESFIKIL